MEVLGYVPWELWALLIGLPVIYFIARNWIVKVPSGKLALLENVFKGRAIETGRILARPNEMGVRRDYWKQGWHIVKYPLTKVKTYVDIAKVDELAIIEALDGAQLPPDRKFADDPAGSITDPKKDFHEKFQNPEGFYDNGGIRGIQLRLATQGPWMIHPGLFKLHPIKRIVIRPGMVGIVTAHDGKPLEAGQILGKKVTGHDHFQNAAAFIANGGQVGAQAEVLPPGTYNMHAVQVDEKGNPLTQATCPVMFTVQEVPALSVPKGKTAVLIAKIGKPLPKGEVCAVTPEGSDDIFTDAQLFIDKQGVQGPQSRMLGAGMYYVNPLAFDHEFVDLFPVEPGFVAARISFIGTEPKVSDQPEERNALSESATDPAETHVNTGVRAVHIAEDGERGLQKKVLQPGNYFFNPYAEKLIKWPISVRTIEWAAEKKTDAQATNYFDRFEIDSNDGQKMKVDVKLNYRVLAEDVPYIIRNLGSLESLESDIIHPIVENIFRNQVTKSPAINYVQKRAEEVEAAFGEAKKALAPYRVEVTGLLITNLIPPEALTNLLSSKSLAEQETQMWAAKEKAQTARIEFENRSAQADQQKALRQAETDITIADNEAKATLKRADGEAGRILKIAKATAEGQMATGTAEATIILRKGDATGRAMRKQAEALGPDGLARLELFKQIASGKVKITPNILVSGGTNGGGDINTGLVTLLLTNAAGEKFQLGAGAGDEAEPDWVTAAAPAAEAPAASETDATGGDPAAKPSGDGQSGKNAS